MPPIKKRNLSKYHEISYNPKLTDRAKEFRKAGNVAEALLWFELKNGKLLGLDFDRQKIIGHYIADFYCAEKNVVIEIDGGIHNHTKEYDAIRNAFLEGSGLTVIHLSDTDVKKKMQDVLLYLKNHPALTT